tara:strand:- start:114 stop:446 length:333 start_codon:yes stop_codon:yes gene_type:complete
MAFVRKKVKTFKWPVEIQEPSADRPGEFDKFEFIAVFKRVKLSELEQMGEESGLPLLKKVLVGWEGIEDEDGKPVPFSSKELELFADDVDWMKGVLSSYTKTYAEAEAGN